MSTISAAKLAANRANAQRSTGPRTAAGKARSSANALRHGIQAERLILPGEDPDAFEALRRALEDEWQPATEQEWLIFDRIVTYFWRLRRAPMIEAGLLASGMEIERDAPGEDEETDVGDEVRYLGAAFGTVARGSDALTKLMRIETRQENNLARAINQLDALQTRRRLEESIYVAQSSAAAVPAEVSSSSPDGASRGTLRADEA